MYDEPTYRWIPGSSVKVHYQIHVLTTDDSATLDPILMFDKAKRFRIVRACVRFDVMETKRFGISVSSDTIDASGRHLARCSRMPARLRERPTGPQRWPRHGAARRLQRLHGFHEAFDGQTLRLEWRDRRLVDRQRHGSRQHGQDAGSTSPAVCRAECRHEDFDLKVEFRFADRCEWRHSISQLAAHGAP